MSKKSPADPVAQWCSIVSPKAELRMAELIETICRETHEEARKQVGQSFVNRLRGQVRYFRIEDGFLGLGSEFPELTAQLELHLGGSAKFSAIDRPDLRLTLGHLENHNDNPFARPFRQGKLTQMQSRKFVAGQMSFMKAEPPSPKRLIAALCFDFANNVPLYTEVRFADAEWQCRNEYRDLRALLAASRQVPVEQVADARETTKRVPTEPIPSEIVADLPHTHSRRQNIERGNI